VAFTLDDGYADQAEVAAPIFAEFECPATIFVTTGFLDGALWFWWDQITYAFDASARERIVVELDRGPQTFDLGAPGSRNGAARRFIALCKSVADVEKQEMIRRLARAAEVDLPSQPPEQYAPMSWEQLTRWESRGISFGPHTVTHPILARADDAESRREIVESWRRLQSKAGSPAAIFCYPNGQPNDFGEREVETLQEIGLAGAVTGTPGYADRPAAGQAGRGDQFRVPRFAYHDDLRSTLQYLNGLEYLKQKLRTGT
jgi:peptidoglycan/xylan/chitin deacetylase (PgdA/CDA1 family)